MSLFTDQFTKLSIPNLGLVRFPTVVISPEERTALGLKANDSNRSILKKLSWSGYLARKAKNQFAGIDEQVVIDRFKVEFETFDKTGVHDYLLLVWDINRWARQQGIVCGRGRGSSASSLTLACLDITDINPLTHNLNFPRFISEARMKPVMRDGVTYVDGKSAPDIDSDYQYLRRADVVRYIEAKYSGRVSKISTRLELTGKMALKDTLKIYAGYTDDEAKHVTDFIEARFGKVQSLYDAKEKNKDIQRWLKDNKKHEDIYAVAMAIEGATVAKGQHPSGVFISFEPLDGTIPTELSKAKDRIGTKDVVTSYDMETVAGLGVKVDILGIRTLDLVAETAALAGISLDSINVNDPRIYDYLQTKDTYVGLFQIEEGSTKEATRKIGPKNVNDLSACLAISRPGALKYVDQYAEFAHKGVIKTIYPAIDEALKDTGNILIYQEQITRVCEQVFGLSGIDADQVRYAVGKKKKEDIAKWEAVLYTNGRARGIPESAIKYFWDVCNASADYLFVLSHSTVYAYLTATTTYLKAIYPSQFYLIALKLSREEPDAIEYMNTIIGEMGMSGIKILPPDLLKSSSDFIMEADGNIRFGMASIKGVSDTTMAKLVSFREQGVATPFITKFRLFEAARAAKVNIATLTGLIYCGCISWPNVDRAKFALEAQTYHLLHDGEKKMVARFAEEYNQDLLIMLKELPQRKDERGKPLIKESRLATLRRDYKPCWDQYQVNSRSIELCMYIMERTYLGFSFTSTLCKCFSAKVANLTPISGLAAKGKEGQTSSNGKTYGGPIRFVAFVDDAKAHLSQKKEPYYKLYLSDDSGEVVVMVFGEERLESCKGFNGRMPASGDIVLVNGKMAANSDGLVFAESVIVQPSVIRIKKGEGDSTSTI